MINKLSAIQFNRIISPWSTQRTARQTQKVNAHGRSWTALHLVWLTKRNRFARTIIKTRHTRELLRIELKQFHRLPSSTNQRVEIRQELATVPQQQQLSSRYVHSKSTNTRFFFGSENLIAAKTRDQLIRGSTFEPSRRSDSMQHCSNKSDFLTRLELKYCIQKPTKDADDSSPAKGLHQDTVYRSVIILRRENARATETHRKPYRKSTGDVIARPTLSQFELTSEFFSHTLRHQSIHGNSSSLPISPVAVTNKPTEVSGSNRMDMTQPAEIVWRIEQRKNLNSQLQDGASLNSSNFVSQTVSAESSTKTKLKPNADSTTHLNSRSTATKTMLDPAIVDRLTEDIIRRVERKMRIDRERRGVGG